MALFHSRSLLRSTPFLAIATIGFFNVLMSAWYADSNGTNRSWPMSWLMAESSINAASLFMVVLLTFYAGELVWRERQVKLDQVLDAAPVRSWSVLAGKFTAMIVLLLAFATTSMLGSMAVQVMKGYPRIDLPVYALHVYLVDFLGWIAMTAIAFFVQSVVPRKAIGNVLVILVWVGNIVTTNLGHEYRLLQIGAYPALQWSDLTGTGPYLAAVPAVHGFNVLLGLLMRSFTALVWRRGTELAAFRARARRWATSGSLWMAAGSGVGLTAAGAVFYFNASVENRYRTRKESEKAAVMYVQTWRRFDTLAPPKVTAIALDVDFEPRAGRARVGSRFTLVNRERRPLDARLVNAAADAPGLGVDG